MLKFRQPPHLGIEPLSQPETLTYRPLSSHNNNGKWVRVALMTAAVAAWQIYDLAAAVEAPRQAVMIMQHVFLSGALIGLASSLIKLASQK